MSRQPDLFGYQDLPPEGKTLARRQDPRTAKESAELIAPQIVPRRDTQMGHVLYCMGSLRKPLTDIDIENWCRGHFSELAEGGYRKRRSDLTRFGYVYDTGTEHWNEVDKRWNIEWGLTERGREMVRELYPELFR